MENVLSRKIKSKIWSIEYMPYVGYLITTCNASIVSQRKSISDCARHLVGVRGNRERAMNYIQEKNPNTNIINLFQSQSINF
jgi:hypothetical protein